MQFQPFRELNGYRHQQGHGSDVVHERGKNGAQPGNRCDGIGRTGGLRQSALGQHVDRAGRLQGPTQNKHAANGNDRRMAKAGKSLFRWHQAGEDAGQQAGEGDNIVPPAAPEKQANRGGKDEQNLDLIRSHSPSRSPESISRIGFSIFEAILEKCITDRDHSRGARIFNHTIGDTVVIAAATVDEFKRHFSGCHGRTRGAVIKKLVPVVAEFVVAGHRNIFRKLNFNFN